MEHSSDNNYNDLRPRQHLPFQTDFFSELAYRPHVSGENGHRKRIKNALQNRDFFKKHCFAIFKLWLSYQ